MKEHIKFFLASVLIIFISVGAAIMVFFPKTISTLGNSTNSYALQTVFSGSTSLGTGTSTVVSLPDAARVFGYLCNTDATSNVYIGFSNYTSTATNTPNAIGTASTTAGVVIFPKTCYSMDNKGNTTWGQINAITASSATTTLLYMFGH